MVDLLLRSDSVVTPEGVGAHDIAISGGKITAVAPHGSLAPPSGGRLIELDGRIVMPGGIDPHVHCAWPMPDPDGGPAALTMPPAVVSRAAIHGGTTTLLDFVRCTDGASVQDAIARRDAGWAGACHTDYAFHLMVEGDIQTATLDQLAVALRNGHPTVKIFTTDITPNRKGRMVDFGDIMEVFQVIAANAGLGVIHAEDNDIVM
ncbi:MAG TPA: hypothetical protein VL154_02235, partial [Acetobacteraceae bacterium]|nr:hypothetical protein [Acetobacteraceae bacterium]